MLPIVCGWLAAFVFWLPQPVVAFSNPSLLPTAFRSIALQPAASTLPTLASDSGVNAAVVEHLRIQVPAQFKAVWLRAEQGSWEPWLAQQEGFLGRDLLWDPKTEEGTLLIRWASREQWKAIPQAEVARVQKRFESLAREGTGQADGNPFPLVFEGELVPQ